MARKRRTPRELSAAADRLHDEVRHLTLLVNALIAPPRPLGPVAEAAVRDAFLARARALAHFLHPVRPRPDDVVAADFFSRPARWSALRLAPSPGLKALRSTAPPGRLTYGGKPAPPPPDGRRVIEIANELSAGVSIFLRHAPRQALGSRWGEVLGGPA